MSTTDDGGAPGPGRYDAVVIGAGPAGGATALLLARAGWSVAVVERAPFPRPKVCGEFMSATNAPLFARLGLAGAVARAAGPEVRRVGLFARDAVVSAPMPRAGGGAGWGRALGREALDALLLDQAVAAGATAWQPWGVTASRREGADHVLALARRGGGGARELRARVVVAAHGSWERSGLATQAGAPRSPGDMMGFKARFTGARLAPDLMPLLAFPGGYGGMVTSDGGRVSLTFCLSREALEAARAGGGPAAPAAFAHVLRHCRGVAEALEGAVLDGPWLAVGPLRPGIRPRFADGVFRAGNAAGEAHPVVAEGISMALQSGWLLAHHLTAAGRPGALDEAALARVGRAYAADWSARFAPRIRAAALFAALATRPGAVGALLPLVRRLPALLTLGASLSGKARLALPPGARAEGAA